MELGATLCTPQSPQCLLCPVAQFCQARKLGLADSLPARRKKRATEKIVLAVAVLLDLRGRTLLLPPPAMPRGQAIHARVSVLVSKLWHFPTIGVRTNAAAELQAHLNRILPPSRTKEPLELEPLPAARHAVTYHAIALCTFRIRVRQLPRVPGAKTISLSDITSPSSLAISNLTRKAARAALAAPAALSARA
jgi:adenine-specific DNA glycosylase